MQKNDGFVLVTVPHKKMLVLSIVFFMAMLALAIVGLGFYLGLVVVLVIYFMFSCSTYASWFKWRRFVKKFEAGSNRDFLIVRYGFGGCGQNGSYKLINFSGNETAQTLRKFAGFEIAVFNRSIHESLVGQRIKELKESISDRQNVIKEMESFL